MFSFNYLLEISSTVLVYTSNNPNALFVYVHTHVKEWMVCSRFIVTVWMEWVLIGLQLLGNFLERVDRGSNTLQEEGGLDQQLLSIKWPTDALGWARRNIRLLTSRRCEQGRFFFQTGAERYASSAITICTFQPTKAAAKDLLTFTAGHSWRKRKP